MKNALYTIEDWYELEESPVEKNAEIDIVKYRSNKGFLSVVYYLGTKDYMVYHEKPDEDPITYESLTWRKARDTFNQLLNMM